MKKINLISRGLSLLLCLSMVSCGGPDGADADTHAAISDVSGGVMTDPAQERARAEVLEALTPSDEGAFAVVDDMVYTNSSGVTRDGWINSIRSDLYEAESRLYEITTDGNDPLMLCTKDGCDHSDIRCYAEPANTGVLSVMPEGSDEELLYYMMLIKRNSPFGANPHEKLESLLGGVIWNSGALFEYNMKTGVRRCVASGLPFMNTCLMYYNGTIYIKEMYGDIRSSMADTVHDYYVIYAVDAITGEYERLDVKETVTPAGVYNGKLYCVGAGGTLYACAPDLSEYEEVTQLGMYLSWFDPATIAGGTLYCRNTDGTLYALPLDGGVSPKKIADKVLSYKCYGGDIYYTVEDYHKYGEYGKAVICAETGGTLWKYDSKTKTSDTVFRDCGGDVLSLDYIDGETIRFYGCYYAGLALGHEYRDLSNGCAFFEYDRDTGEVKLIYELQLG